jgi:hypothetical protein
MHTFYYIFKGNIENIPFPHFPKTHCSIVPLFQHSNWGEAPKFIAQVVAFQKAGITWFKVSCKLKIFHCSRTQYIDILK